MWAYPEMVKMLFSPRVISVTPSPQPSLCQPMAISSGAYKAPGTFDDLANANLCPEVPTAYGRIESRCGEASVSEISSETVCVPRSALRTYCLPLKSFSGPTLGSYRLPVYSMVTSSPFLGLSVPLPCLIIFRLTTIVLVELAGLLRAGRRNGVVVVRRSSQLGVDFRWVYVLRWYLRLGGRQVNGPLVEWSGILLDPGQVTYRRLVEANERQSGEKV